MRRMTEGLSDMDYMSLTMKDVMNMPAEDEESRQLKQQILQVGQSIIARMSEPDDEITHELGRQADEWLANPKSTDK